MSNFLSSSASHPASEPRSVAEVQAPGPKATPYQPKVASMITRNYPAPTIWAVTRGFRQILLREIRGGVVSSSGLMDSVFPKERIEAEILEGSQIANFSEFVAQVSRVLHNSQGAVLDLTTEREKAWADYFNSIASSMVDANPNLQQLRRWSSQYSSRPIENNESLRKPDLVLLSVENMEGTSGWSKVYSVAEEKKDAAAMTAQADDSLDMELLDRAFFIFCSQLHRRFIVSLGIAGRTLRLSLFNRSGVAQGKAWQLDPKCGSGFSDLVRVLFGFMFGDEQDLGLDCETVKLVEETLDLITGSPTPSTSQMGLPTSLGFTSATGKEKPTRTDEQPEATTSATTQCTGRKALARTRQIDDHNRIKHVLVGDTWYRILQTLHVSPSVRGRGTIVWKAIPADEPETEDGNRKKWVTIKDVWADASRQHDEAEFLQKANKDGVRGVPEFVDSADVMIDGKEDDTDRHHGFEEPDMRGRTRPEKRVHRRYVTRGCGIPITRFRNKKELLLIFVGLIETHRELVENAGILHRDISMRNVMMIEDEDDPNIRRSLLIDFDFAAYASDANSNDTTSIANRTGTIPFMAISILRGRRRHQPRHDLESFFYVLLFICLEYDGPERLRDLDSPFSGRQWDIYSTRLGAWIQGGDLAAIGAAKRDDTAWSSDFHESVLQNLPPYFEDLAGCLEALRAAVNADSVERCPPYDIMINILREWWDKPLAEPDPDDAASPTADSSQLPAPKSEQEVDETTLFNSPATPVPPEKHNGRKRPREDEIIIHDDPLLMKPCMLPSATLPNDPKDVATAVQVESFNPSPSNSLSPSHSSLTAASTRSGSLDHATDATRRTKRLRGA